MPLLAMDALGMMLSVLEERWRFPWFGMSAIARLCGNSGCCLLFIAIFGDFFFLEIVCDFFFGPLFVVLPIHPAFNRVVYRSLIIRAMVWQYFSVSLSTTFQFDATVRAMSANDVTSIMKEWMRKGLMRKDDHRLMGRPRATIITYDRGSSRAFVWNSFPEHTSDFPVTSPCIVAVVREVLVSHIRQDQSMDQFHFRSKLWQAFHLHRSNLSSPEWASVAPVWRKCCSNYVAEPEIFLQ